MARLALRPRRVRGLITQNAGVAGRVPTGSPPHADTLRAVQTRYLILASLAVGLVILAATALWFTTL